MPTEKITNMLFHYAHKLKPSRNAQQTLNINKLQLLPTLPISKNCDSQPMIASKTLEKRMMMKWRNFGED